MSCNNDCGNATNTNKGGYGLIIIIVLYILLAIILGSRVAY